MKKYYLIFLLIFLIPSFTYAAWWNPFSWNIFSFLFNHHSQVQTINSTTTTTTLSNQGSSKIIKIPHTFQPPQQQTSTYTAPPVQQNTTQQQPVVTTPPPNITLPSPPSNTNICSGTLCNGTCYSACPTGQDFVCPQGGSAYCQASQQQLDAQAAQQVQQQQQQQIEYQQEQAQAAAAQQQKTDQINALTSAYNTQYNALQQQIINIKNQYYTDLANIENSRTNLSEAAGEENNLLNKDNALISQIQLQEQQLYLNYETQLNALQ